MEEIESLQTIQGSELSRRLMALPARQRLNAILDRVDSEAVVRAMAPQDFYFSVQDIGPEDALPLLALAGVDQINHLFDVEWWQKDSVLPARAVEWLDRLARASEESLLAWLYHADFELLIMLFKKWIMVDIAREDEDPMEVRDRLSMSTIDDTYYWEARYPQYEDFIRNLLGLLFEVNQSFYRELMSHVLHSLDVEVEEDAYRFHRGRMEDNAIPDFYDALEIYRPLKHLKTMEKNGAVAGDADSVSLPSFAVALVPRGDCLGRALGSVQDPAVAGGLQLELAALANKVLVADQLPADSAESLKFAVAKAAAFVNLGLELCCKEDDHEASRCIREIMMEDLFRVGHSQALQLQWKLNAFVKKGWLASWPRGIQGLDLPWREEAELLMDKTPRVPRRQSGEGVILESDFTRTRKDVRRSARFVRMLEAMDHVEKELKVPWKELEPVLWPEAQISELQDVTLGALIMTSAATLITKGLWAPIPLEVKSWQSVFPLLHVRAMENAVTGRVRKMVSDPRRVSLVDTYLKPVLESYAREMGRFSTAGPPEPQYVNFFLFSQHEWV